MKHLDQLLTGTQSGGGGRTLSLLGLSGRKNFLVCSEAAETVVNVTTPPPEPVPDFKVH